MRGNRWTRPVVAALLAGVLLVLLLLILDQLQDVQR